MKERQSDTQRSIVNTFDRAAKNFGQRGPRQFEYFGQRLVELADIAPGAKVLDVATGRGAVLFPTADRVRERLHLCDRSGRGHDTGDKRRNRAQAARECRYSADGRSGPHIRIGYVRLGTRSFCTVLFFESSAGAARIPPSLASGGAARIDDLEATERASRDYRRYIEKYLPDEVRRKDAAGNRFETPELLGAALTEAGFASLSVKVEEAILFFPDEETLWLAVTSGGMGRILDIAGPSALPNIRQDIVQAAREKREERGVPVRFRALVGFGTKPE